MFKNKKKIIIIAVVILVILAAVIFVKSKRKSSKLTAKSVTTVQTKKLQEKIYLSGKIEAKSKAKVAFMSDSKITWMGVKEGDSVKKYQTLAKQDTNEVEKSLKLSLNNFLATRWDFDKTTEDNKYSEQVDQKLAKDMKRIVDKAQLTLDNAVIDVELKNLAQQKSFLASPIKGVIVKAPLSQTGSYPGATDYFDIVDPETEYISAMVGQQDVIKLKVGQKANITLDSYRETPFSAVVESISYGPVDTVNNKYEVKLSYKRDPEKYSYHLGMTGEIEILLAEKNDVLVLSRQYITSDKGKRYVMVINGKNAPEKKEVVTGMETYEEMEILSGLKVGDTVSLSK